MQLSLDALTSVRDLQLWSAERPSLYVLVLEVVDEGGEVQEYESCQVSLEWCTKPEHIMHARGRVSGKTTCTCFCWLVVMQFVSSTCNYKCMHIQVCTACLIETLGTG